MKKKLNQLIKLWAIVCSWMFAYLSIVVFFTVYLQCYISGSESITIYINLYGEMIYELIMMGFVMVISIISFIMSIFLSFKKHKNIMSNSVIIKQK